MKKKRCWRKISDRQPLTNIKIEQYARRFGIPHFRGVFMRNRLPNRIHRKERAVVNLDNDNGPGTHWVAYKKNGRQVIYFDSYGNLPPPMEMVSYFHSSGASHIQYNYNVFQKFNTVNCGQLCLYFLCQ